MGKDDAIPRYPWLAIRSSDGKATVDTSDLVDRLTKADPSGMPELQMRMYIATAINEGYVQLVPKPEPENPLGGAEKRAWEKLRNIMAVTTNPYKTNKGAWMIYRFRLFSPSERRALREAIRKAASQPYQTASGCAGMMDELEMVNFESNGKLIKDLKREI